jgi:hypothetical protein
MDEGAAKLCRLLTSLEMTRGTCKIREAGEMQEQGTAKDMVASFCRTVGEEKVANNVSKADGMIATL